MISKLPRVRMFSTGGTWGAIRVNGVLVPDPKLEGTFAVEDIFELVELPDGSERQRAQDYARATLWHRQLNSLATLSGFGFEPIDSTDMGPKYWTRVANRILQEKDEYDAFIIATGTDTMHYLAPAMAFALQGLNKPVVITGAQKPRLDPGSDALFNIMNAILVATQPSPAWKAFKPALPEVVIVFDKRIISATRGRKFSERDLDAFRSINVPDRGGVAMEIWLSGNGVLPQSDGVQPTASPACESLQSLYRPTNANPIAFDAEVALQYLYPGMSPAIVWSLHKQHGAKAIVLAAFGAGNIPKVRMPETRSFKETIEDLSERKVPVIITTGCVYGVAEFKNDRCLYPGGQAAQDACAIIATDMLPEVAFVKAKWLLSNDGIWYKGPGGGDTGREIDMEEFGHAMQHSYAGEITSADELNRIFRSPFPQPLSAP